VRVCANPRRVRRGVSHGGILTDKAEVVKRRRKRATDDWEVGALLKGTVRSDSVRVSETSSGWLCSTFLSMDYWLWERHTSRREKERSFIHTARRILYERVYRKLAWLPPGTCLCLFVGISHPNPDMDLIRLVLLLDRRLSVSLASKPAVHDKYLLRLYYTTSRSADIGSTSSESRHTPFHL